MSLLDNFSSIQEGMWQYTFNNLNSIPKEWGIKEEKEIKKGLSNLHSFYLFGTYVEYYLINDEKTSSIIPAIYICENSNHLVSNKAEDFNINTGNPQDSYIKAKFVELKENKKPICIRYNGYLYKLFTEIKQTISFAELISKTEPTKNTFEPYEPINLAGLTIKFKNMQNTISSLGIEKKELGVYDFKSWDELIYYSTEYSYENKYTETSIGKQQIYFKYYETKFSWDIYITDFKNKYFELRENPNANFNIYAGQEVGEDFLDSHNITLVRYNDYKTIEGKYRSYLEKDKMSKTIISNTENSLNFTYQISTNNFVECVVDTNIHHYTKFDVLHKSEFTIGDILNPYKFEGNLYYDDNTFVSLSNIEYNESKYITYSIDDTSITVETPRNFTATYTLPTKHFGTLSKTYDCEVVDNRIFNVELSDMKTNFKYGEVLEFGSNATAKCYNAYGELIKTGTLSDIITEQDSRFGKIINEKNNLLSDQPIKLWVKVNDIKVEYEVIITYAQKLNLDISGFNNLVYINENFEDFDYSEITATVNYNNELIDVTDLLQFNHVEINPNSDTTICNITASVNYDGRNLTKTFVVQCERIRPNNIIVYGTSNEYFNNDSEIFKKPEELDFELEFNNGDSEEIDIDKLVFYVDEECETNAENQIIRSSNGNTIYFKHKDYSNIVGKYTINFKEDKIIGVELLDNVDFVLGNKLNDFRDLFNIRAKFESGTDNSFRLDNYTFVDEDYILVSKEIKIVYEEKEYTLSQSKINFIKPEISDITINKPNFPEVYYNKTDFIDVSNITIDINYENAKYSNTATIYQQTGINSNDNFTVKCSELSNYKFNGSQLVNITIASNETRKVLELVFEVQNLFDNSKKFTKTLPIYVVEITEITGLSLVKTYTDYKTGESFLNENDDTTLLIYYKDQNGNHRKLQMMLRSGIGALNIYPLKNTVFKAEDREKKIRVSSATNHNIYVEYSISVTPNYQYSSTTKHNLRVVWCDEYWRNHEPILEKYLIVDNDDTQVVNGVRTLKPNKTFSDIKVYGYLEDVNDVGKQARVIMFEDHIPPVDGESNIAITYPCYVSGNADYINKCHFGHLFGNNNAKNRLFLSGNPDLPNCDWHSGGINLSKIDGETIDENGDFTYFEDTSYCFYGQTDNKVIGYDIVSNDKMVVLKSYSDKEPCVYYRTNGLIQALDGSGNEQKGFNSTTLYEESYPLVIGNMGAGALSNKSITNFNGDTLFMSSDNQVDGLDVIGIIGDSQRSAYTRSLYINPLLRKEDLSEVQFFTNNKYLYLIFKDYLLVTHFEKYDSETKQYEWWKLNIKNVSSMIEINDKIYYGTNDGKFCLLENGQYRDITKTFIGAGGSLFASVEDEDNIVQVSNMVIDTIKPDREYYFKLVPEDNNASSYMYYQVATMSNTKTGNVDIYIDNENNLLEIIGHINSKTDNERLDKINNLVGDKKIYYINHFEGTNDILGSGTTYYKQYKLKYIEDAPSDRDCFKLVEADTDTEVDLSRLYQATLCLRLDGDYKITDVDYENYTFKLLENDETLNIVQYGTQNLYKQFKAEIKEFTNVKAYYITAPFTMGNLMYNKTIWGWTLTNDTDIPSSIEVCQALNTEDFEKMAKVSDNVNIVMNVNQQQKGYDLDDLSFRDMDFDKYVIPHKYTFYRPLNVPFICFGFRNNDGTNAVLSTMQIVYTVPMGSVGRG